MNNQPFQIAKINKRRKKKTFDLNSEAIIINYMREWAKEGRTVRNPFVQLSTLIPFDSKQICHHWWNKLDPRLNRDTPFYNDEKQYIYEWVEDFIRNDSNGNIQWKILQSKVERKFGRLRSRNDLKNIWYARKRKTRQQQTTIGLNMNNML